MVIPVREYPESQAPRALLCLDPYVSRVIGLCRPAKNHFMGAAKRATYVELLPALGRLCNMSDCRSTEILSGWATSAGWRSGNAGSRPGGLTGSPHNGAPMECAEREQGHGACRDHSTLMAFEDDGNPFFVHEPSHNCNQHCNADNNARCFHMRVVNSEPVGEKHLRYSFFILLAPSNPVCALAHSGFDQYGI